MFVQIPSSLHGFVGAVGLAGVEGGLWAVEGGNYRVAQCALQVTTGAGAGYQCALQMSGAGLLRARVTGLEGRQGGGYTLRYCSSCELMYSPCSFTDLYCCTVGRIVSVWYTLSSVPHVF